MDNIIKVKTPIGVLTACAYAEDDYPEIFVYLTRDDGVEIDLVVAGVNTAERTANAYVYQNTHIDDYTFKHTWTEADINGA